MLNITSLKETTVEIINSNYVFSGNQILDGVYILINNYVFLVQYKDIYNINDIALNANQRNICNISLQNQIDLNLYESLNDIDINELTIGILAGKTKISNINYNIIYDIIENNLMNQIIKLGQKIVIRYIENNKHCDCIIEITSFKKNNNTECFGKICVVTEIYFSSDKRFIPSNTECVYIKKEPIVNTINLNELGIGGLNNEFNEIHRSVFLSRCLPPKQAEALGITHVKGLILYGHPGTGKTLFARQIGKMLNCVDPIIVNGPELLNSYIGKSEENVRKLFENAEKDYNANKSNADLHLIIIDEMDALCKIRTSGTDAGSNVNNNIINQFLTKIDGINSLPNILIIGMTNRLELIDKALLRPGRFEKHIEIKLPDEQSREQILNIHLKKIYENNSIDKQIDIKYLANITQNYSGAELAGLVRETTSFALKRIINDDNKIKETSNLLITFDDFMNAFNKIIPSFGIDKNINIYLKNEFYNYGNEWDEIIDEKNKLIEYIKMNKPNNYIINFEGDKGTGKTSNAVKLANEMNISHITFISKFDFIGLHELDICKKLKCIFDNATSILNSIIIIDNFEQIIECNFDKTRYQNSVLQTLVVLISQNYMNKLYTIITSDIDIFSYFNIEYIINTKISLKMLNTENIKKICEIKNCDYNNFNMYNNISIKFLLNAITRFQTNLVLDSNQTNTFP